MESNGRNPIVRGALTAVLCVLASIAGGYIRSVVINKGVYEPDVFQLGVFAVFMFLVGYFAPTPAQARQSRQNLKDKLAGKK